MNTISDNQSTIDARKNPDEVQTQELSGAQVVLKACIAEGVDTIFGYPGGAIMPIYDALYDFNDQLEHILVRHEQGG
ncbi:MAG: biosynthetic-type acetolactate synthase large subunit, partial [Bacteroidota bacterium]